MSIVNKKPIIFILAISITSNIKMSLFLQCLLTESGRTYFKISEKRSDLHATLKLVSSFL